MEAALPVSAPVEYICADLRDEPMNHPHKLRSVAAWLLCLLLGSCRSHQPPVTQTYSGGVIESPALPPIEVPNELPAGSSAAASVPATTATDPIVRIRDEGLNRS